MAPKRKPDGRRDRGRSRQERAARDLRAGGRARLGRERRRASGRLGAAAGAARRRAPGEAAQVARARRAHATLAAWTCWRSPRRKAGSRASRSRSACSRVYVGGHRRAGAAVRRGDGARRAVAVRHRAGGADLGVARAAHQAAARCRAGAGGGDRRCAHLCARARPAADADRVLHQSGRRRRGRSANVRQAMPPPATLLVLFLFAIVFKPDFGVFTTILKGLILIAFLPAVISLLFSHPHRHAARASP